MGNTITMDYVLREFGELIRHLSQYTIHELAAKYQKDLNKMKYLPLNIAVIGQAGSGKSSFVNAIRGVMDDDKEEAAEVGAVEQTMEPKAYPHPSFSNILIWDLPGIGTCSFKAEEYLKKVDFERYDVFIMITADRFTENDALLAKEIQRTTKKFYYVRSKIDNSIKGEKRKRNFDMEKSLATLRSYCEDSLRKAGLSARVFLISSWKVDKYEFRLLQATMVAELPDYKKQILTLAMHLFSESELMEKKERMKCYIRKVALISCACGALGLPGLSTLCDLVLLQEALKCICNAFGFNHQALRFLAFQTGKELEELRLASKKTPLVSTINEQFVTTLFKKSSACENVRNVEYVLDFIPIIGSLFGGPSSYIITYHFLNSFLDDAVEDAQNVRVKLLE